MRVAWSRRFADSRIRFAGVFIGNFFLGLFNFYLAVPTRAQRQGPRASRTILDSELFAKGRLLWDFFYFTAQFFI